MIDQPWASYEDLRMAVAQLAENHWDDEMAHGQEDEIWQRTLASVASGVKHPERWAAEALKTAGLRFSRWYA